MDPCIARSRPRTGGAGALCVRGVLRAAAVVGAAAALTAWTPGVALATETPAGRADTTASVAAPAAAPVVLLPGPVAPGRAPLTAPAAEVPSPSEPPVSRAGRNPFLALVLPDGSSAPTGDAAAVEGQRLLRRGAAGEDVRRLQELLVARGADLAADGVYGPRTVAAVRAFQRAAGLVVDGLTGPRTWEAVEAP